MSPMPTIVMHTVSSRTVSQPRELGLWSLSVGALFPRLLLREGLWVTGGVLTGPLPPALLLLYDVTNKASFDNIQVSGFLLGR